MVPSGIPVFRAGSRKVRVGPYLVDMERNLVRAEPWPEWMEDLFPQSLMSFLNPSWAPVGYSAWKDGGVWAIRTGERMEWSFGSGASVLFLDPDGGLLRRAVLPEPDTEAGERVLVFGEWVMAMGCFLRGFEVAGRIRKDAEDISSMLHDGRACLGPDGMLILPDGRAVLPDGSEFSLFRPDMVMAEVMKTTDGRVSENPDSVSAVLGFDGHDLWVLVGRNRILDDSQGVAITRVRVADGGKPSVEIVRLLGNESYPWFFPLNDGGWVVSYPEEVKEMSGPGKRRRRKVRLFVRLPGARDVVEHEVDGMYGREFFSDRHGGLLALAEGDGSRLHGTFLLSMDGKRVDVVRIGSMDFLELDMLLSRGWVTAGDGPARAVILGREKIRNISLPEMSITPDDLMRRIFRKMGEFIHAINSLLCWRDVILVHVTDYRRNRDLLFRFRLSGRRLKLMDIFPFAGEPTHVEILQKTPDLFHGLITSARTGRVAEIMMSADGGFRMSVVC